MGHMMELFGHRLNYDIFPIIQNGDEPKIFWPESELKDFLEERAVYLSNNVGKGLFYDSLVVIVSGHGVPRYICTSDYRLYSKLAIHRTFSFHANLRDIPRFVLYDCCQGGNSKKKTIDLVDMAKEEEATKNVKSNTLNVTDNTQKRVEEDDIFDGDANPKWEGDDENPDHLLGRVNAANQGFVSNLNSLYGSWVIYKMFTKYMAAINGNKTMPFIHSIFDEIQKELQLEGRQLPECTYNDGVRYLCFAKNKNKKVGNIDIGGDGDDDVKEREVSLEATKGKTMSDIEMHQIRSMSSNESANNQQIDEFEMELKEDSVDIVYSNQASVISNESDPNISTSL